MNLFPCIANDVSEFHHGVDLVMLSLINRCNICLNLERFYCNIAEVKIKIGSYNNCLLVHSRAETFHLSFLYQGKLL